MCSHASLWGFNEKEEAKPVDIKTAKNKRALAVCDGEILEYRLIWSYFANAVMAGVIISGIRPGI